MIGQIILVVVAIVVTVVVAYGTGGTGTAPVAKFWGAVFGAGTKTAAVATGATAAAAGSIASQGVGVATGIQEKFSWNAVAVSAIAGGVGGAFPSEGLTWSQSALRGAGASALTQGISVALGFQSKFSWAGVAAAGVGAGVATGVGDHLAGLGASDVALKTGAITASSIANAATRSAVDGSSFGDNLRASIPDVVGQAIASVVTNRLTAKNNPVAKKDSENGGSAEGRSAPGDGPVDSGEFSLGTPIDFDSEDYAMGQSDALKLMEQSGSAGLVSVGLNLDQPLSAPGGAELFDELDYLDFKSDDYVAGFALGLGIDPEFVLEATIDYGSDFSIFNVGMNGDEYAGAIAGGVFWQGAGLWDRIRIGQEAHGILKDLANDDYARISTSNSEQDWWADRNLDWQNKIRFGGLMRPDLGNSRLLFDFELKPNTPSGVKAGYYQLSRANNGQRAIKGLQLDIGPIRGYSAGFSAPQALGFEGLEGIIHRGVYADYEFDFVGSGLIVYNISRRFVHERSGMGTPSRTPAFPPSPFGDDHNKQPVPVPIPIPL